MKGAIGNAFILNIVITFMLIFLLLVVGSMAYTKAYKVKNFLLNEVVSYVDEVGFLSLRDFQNGTVWSNRVNPYLASSGYHLRTKNNSCPAVSSTKETLVINPPEGFYDYCIYIKRSSFSGTYAIKNSSLSGAFNYRVLVYMKLDLPVVGNYIKIPISGETKMFYEAR